MNIVSELEAILQQEQEHLLNGDFDGLQELVDRKTRLTERLALERPDLSPETFRHLSERAQQNEALLESARLGLQAAMQQLRDTEAPKEQTTYSSSGQRKKLSKAPSSVTQKI